MKTIKKLASLLLVMCLVCGMTACRPAEENAKKEYRIIYADDRGPHNILVKTGDLFSIDSIPQRIGYNFLGLFDAETGGKQYVHANGLALAPFSSDSDIVLYPQYELKTFTVALDFCDGSGTAPSDEIVVSYNDKIPALPTDAYLAGNIFLGWYNAPEGGDLVCDTDGTVTLKGKVNENNFDLENTNKITLYARYVNARPSVRFFFDASDIYTAVEVDYNSTLSDAIPTRDVLGKIVTAWSTVRDDSTLSHKVDTDMRITTNLDLYAARYSAYITFDTDGGNKIDPVTGEVGDDVELPTPQKPGYTFTGWKLASGDAIYTTAVIRNDPQNFIAQWSRIVVALNANGASGVSPTVKPKADGSVELPIPARQNYVFCGWFDSSDNFYWSSITPKANISLTAKWVNAKIVNESNLWSEEYNGDLPTGVIWDKNKTWQKKKTVELPSELNKAVAAGKVKVNVSMQLKVWVRTKGDATATVSITANVNNQIKDGPTMTEKGGGYPIFGSNPKPGPIKDDVRKTISFTFDAPTTSKFDISLTYKMDSNKENSKVSTDVHFVCLQLTVDLVNK